MKNVVTVRLSETEMFQVHQRIEDRLARDSGDPVEMTGTISWEGIEGSDPLLVRLVRVDDAAT